MILYVEMLISYFVGKGRYIPGIGSSHPITCPNFCYYHFNKPFKPIQGARLLTESKTQEKKKSLNNSFSPPLLPQCVRII